MAKQLLFAGPVLPGKSGKHGKSGQIYGGFVQNIWVAKKTQIAANHSRGFFGGATFYLKQGKPISEKIEKRGFDQICTAEHF